MAVGVRAVWMPSGGKWQRILGLAVLAGGYMGTGMNLLWLLLRCDGGIFHIYFDLTRGALMNAGTEWVLSLRFLSVITVVYLMLPLWYWYFCRRLKLPLGLILFCWMGAMLLLLSAYLYYAIVPLETIRYGYNRE